MAESMSNSLAGDHNFGIASENWYTPQRSILGDAYRNAAGEALDSNNSGVVRIGSGVAATILAVPGLLNDVGRDLYNLPNKFVVSGQDMSIGYSTGDPYRFSNGLMNASIGLLESAGVSSALKNGMLANQAANEYVSSSSAARVSYGANTVAETLAPRVNVADEFIMKTGKNGSTTLQYGNPEGVHGLIVNVDKNGVLGFEIRAPQGGSSMSQATGTDMFLSATQRLQQEGVQVNSIRGTWIEGTDSVNSAQYLSNLSKGMTPQQAAANTWTGRIAASQGYTNVGVPKTGYGTTTVIFGK